jgi:acyl-CoA synthetase (AMP-forming)/AMP-acid ligase II
MKPAVTHGLPLVLPTGVAPNVPTALAHRVAQWPHGTIRTFSHGDNGPAPCYSDQWRRSGAIAAALRKFCRHSADTVVLLVEDAVDFVPAFWACIRGGYVAVPLMTAAREALHRSRSGALHEALSRLSNVNILVDESFEEFAALLRRDSGLPTISLATAEADSRDIGEDGAPADPVCLVPTSGSTGRIKLTALRSLALRNRNFADELKKEQSYLGTFGLDGINGLNPAFLRWGSWTHMPATLLAAKPTSVLDAIEQHSITDVLLTGSMVKRIMTEAKQTNRRWKLDSLRRVGVGAEMLVPRILRRFAKFTEENGAPSDIIRTGYGTTETGGLVSGANPLDQPVNDHEAVCLGRSARGVGLRIVGMDGEIVAEGEVGEVQVSCPQLIFAGYSGEPEATRECFTDDGWWRTGDLGRIRNGLLSLHGRAKEVFIVSGKKIALGDIDNHIETILAAGDFAVCCAIHWPGETAERLAVVFATTNAHAQRTVELARNIRHLVTRRFGFFPNPIIAASLEEIPFAANGKLRRMELAARVRSGAIGVVQELTDATHTERSRGSRPADFERGLKQIWHEVFGFAGPFDRHASFFDLGG